MNASVPRPRPYTELPLSSQTAYAQLFEAAVAFEQNRSAGSVQGSFSPKQVRGATYWYFQFTDASGALRQEFVGPDSPEVRGLVEASRAAPSKPLDTLARIAEAGGNAPVLLRHLRVLRRLADAGFFRAGGVLVGTHAYLASQGMLGVRWGEGSRTEDIDLAHAGRNLSVALPGNLTINTHDAIQSLKLGLLPVSSLSAVMGTTYLNPREPEFRLDFLTTLHRGRDAPFEHERLGVALQPLRFMEFLLEDVRQAALFSRGHVVLVNLPHPARYALHKLLVHGERAGALRTKASKDLVQAASLIAWHLDHDDEALKRAQADLVSRGARWDESYRRGRHTLDKAWPELDLEGHLPIPARRRTTRATTKSQPA